MTHRTMPYKPRGGDESDTVQLEVPQFADLDDAWTRIAEATGSGEDFDSDLFTLNRLNIDLAQGAKATYANATKNGKSHDEAAQLARDYMIGKPRGSRTGVTKAKAQAFQAAVAQVILSGQKFTKEVEATLRAEYGIPEDWTP